jgi:hypothetical protein
MKTPEYSKDRYKLQEEKLPKRTPFPAVKPGSIVCVWNSFTDVFNTCSARAAAFADEKDITNVLVRTKSGSNVYAYWNKTKARFEYADETFMVKDQLLPVISNDLKSFAMLKTGQAYYVLNKAGEVAKVSVSVNDFNAATQTALRFQTAKAAENYLSRLGII